MSSYPRHARITAADHGALVNIASWTLMVTSILFTSFRLLSNKVLKGVSTGDDVLVTGATLLGAAQSIATSYAVKHGLGRHQDMLDSTAINDYQKAILANSILYVSTLAASKLSLLYFLHGLLSVKQRLFNILIRSTGVIISLCLLSEVFVLAFQCNIPDTHDYIQGNCIGLLAFWDFDAVFDIITSLVILVLPAIVIFPLKLKTSFKFQAVSGFVFQMPACGFAVVRLYYLHKAFSNSDHTWQAVDWQIWTAINMHFGIVAANIPCLKVFLEGFQSTLYRHDPDAVSTNENSARSLKSESASKIGGTSSIEPDVVTHVHAQTTRDEFMGAKDSASDEVVDTEGNERSGNLRSADDPIRKVVQ